MTSVPEEYELVAILGLPVSAEPSDGYWCFEVVRGASSVRFSFDIHEESVQTFVRSDSASSLVSCEGCNRIAIKGGAIHCDFVGSNAKTVLDISVDGVIDVRWSTLLNEPRRRPV